MHTPQDGNKILLLAAALLLALASMFTSWGRLGPLPDVISLKPPLIGFTSIYRELFGDPAFGRRHTSLDMPVPGLAGVVILGPLRVPLWWGSLAGALAIVMLILNQVKFSAVPRRWTSLLLMVALLEGGFAIVMLGLTGSLGVGGVMLLLAVVMGWRGRAVVRTI